jgi:type II secretory pathway component PulJ
MYIALAISAALVVAAYLALNRLARADEHDRQTEVDFGITDQ